MFHHYFYEKVANSFVILEIKTIIIVKRKIYRIFLTRVVIRKKQTSERELLSYVVFAAKRSKPTVITAKTRRKDTW